MAFFTAVFAASAMDGEELASGPACWSAGFWHPATSMPTDKADNQIVARRRFIKSSTGWTVFFKHTLIHCEVNLPWSHWSVVLLPNEPLASKPTDQCDQGKLTSQW